MQRRAQVCTGTGTRPRAASSSKRPVWVTPCSWQRLEQSLNSNRVLQTLPKGTEQQLRQRGDRAALTQPRPPSMEPASPLVGGQLLAAAGPPPSGGVEQAGVRSLLSTDMGHKQSSPGALGSVINGSPGRAFRSDQDTLSKALIPPGGEAGGGGGQKLWAPLNSPGVSKCQVSDGSGEAASR